MSAAAAVAAALTVVMVAGRLRTRPARLTLGSPTPDRRAHHRRRGIVGALGGVAVGVLIGGPLFAAGAVAGACMHRRVRRVRNRRRHLSSIARSYPDFVDLLVLTIGAGCPPFEAVTILADVAPEPIRPALQHVALRVGLGARFADAVAELTRDPPEGVGAIAQPLADALALADRYGTPLAPVLDRLADEARNHRRRNAEAAARQLPVRLAFPLVGCTLPSFVLLTIVPLMAGTLSSLRGLAP